MVEGRVDLNHLENWIWFEPCNIKFFVQELNRVRPLTIESLIRFLAIVHIRLMKKIWIWKAKMFAGGPVCLIKTKSSSRFENFYEANTPRPNLGIYMQK